MQQLKESAKGFVPHLGLVIYIDTSRKVREHDSDHEVSHSSP